MPQEAAPTISPGEPCFLPLDESKREQFFRTAQFKNKTPELAKHGNDVVVSDSDTFSTAVWLILIPRVWLSGKRVHSANEMTPRGRFSPLLPLTDRPLAARSAKN